MTGNDPLHGVERLNILQGLAKSLGLNVAAASEICRTSAEALRADACLITLTSVLKQHVIGAHGLRTSLQNFDRCFGDECLDSSFFEMLDLPGNAMSCHSPLVNGTVDSFQSLIATPLFFRGRIVGEILFFFRDQHAPFTDQDRRSVLVEKRKAQAYIAASVTE